MFLNHNNFGVYVFITECLIFLLNELFYTTVHLDIVSNNERYQSNKNKFQKSNQEGFKHLL